MNIVTFLIAFSISLNTAASITMTQCENSWLTQEKWENAVAIELASIPQIDRNALNIQLSECSEDNLVITVRYQNTKVNRQISLNDTPIENRHRTLGLMLGDLLQECIFLISEKRNFSESAPPPKKDKDSGQSYPSTLLANECPENSITNHHTETKYKPDLKPSAGTSKKPITQPKNRPVRFETTVHGRYYPQQTTVAPELKLTLRIKRVIVGWQTYGMGWSDNLGTVSLVSNSLTGGINLWQTIGRVVFGWDLLTELGIIVASGSANNAAAESRHTNVILGGHTGWWLRFSSKKSSHFQISLATGWMRGLKVYAASRKKGGFHGFVISCGLGWVW